MSTKDVRLAIYAMAASLLCACSAGPSEGELVEACLKGGHPQLVDEAMCKCFASAMLEDMPPELRQAMLLEMQGNRHEAARILEKLSFEEQADIAMKQIETLGQCVG